MESDEYHTLTLRLIAIMANQDTLNTRVSTAIDRIATTLERVETILRRMTAQSDDGTST